MRLTAMLDLATHGPDVFVGAGPHYPWGGLYGGQIVAQAWRAAASTVGDGFDVHSLRAYFIRRGNHTEPVRYEVDRIRNGRSFCTRRVVARQAVGAILNLETSFHVAEPSTDVEAVTMPTDIPGPDELESSSWSDVFDRHFIPGHLTGSPAGSACASGTATGGRATAWLRVTEDLGSDQLLQPAALAFLSDDLPTDAVVRAHPVGAEPRKVLDEILYTATLDHTIWFHRPLRTDEWHLHDFTCHTFVGGRGLALGHVFAADGTHAATIAQEILLRDVRER